MAVARRRSGFLFPRSGPTAELDGLDALPWASARIWSTSLLVHQVGVGEEEDDLGLQAERRAQGHHVVGAAVGSTV